MSVGLNSDTKYRIIEDFQKTENKTKTASLYGVSPRTVGRIVKEYDWVIQNEPYRTIYQNMNMLVLPEDVIDDHIITDQELMLLDDICVKTEFLAIGDHEIADFIYDPSTDTFKDVIGRALNTIDKATDVVSIDVDEAKEVVDDYLASVEEVEEVDDETPAVYDLYDYEWNLVATAQSITVTKTDKATHETESVEIAKGTDNFRNAWAVIREIDMSDEECVAIGADEIYSMADPKLAIEKFSQGKLTVNVKTETIYYDGVEVHNSLTNRIINMTMTRGIEGAQALVNFLEKLMENPSYRAVNSLYDFLDHNDIEIGSSGNFYAWKRVRSDYTDCYTGTIDNSVGAEPSMPRNMVNEDPEQTCSYGLHVAAKHYLGAFHGEITLRCEVDPRDVVAIPRDYKNSKMRVCRYKVVEDVTANFNRM